MNKVIAIILFITCVLGCAGDTKKPPTDTANLPSRNPQSVALEDVQLNPCRGQANVYVSPEKAEVMKDRFVGEYLPRQGRNKLHLSEMLDRQLVKDLFDALQNTTTNFDGIRVYYGAEGILTKTSLFLLVPTKPANNSKHYNVWGPTITNTSNYKYVNLKYVGNAEKLIKNFRKHFKGQLNGSANETAQHPGFSSAVWINECVFEIMQNFLTSTNGNGFKGFRIWAAAYPSSTDYDQTIGNTVTSQSTILLVPVDANGIDNWNILAESLNSAKAGATAEKIWKNALNHGQLCPNLCPDTDE